MIALFGVSPARKKPRDDWTAGLSKSREALVLAFVFMPRE
jgi:hypothetical protein